MQEILFCYQTLAFVAGISTSIFGGLGCSVSTNISLIDLKHLINKWDIKQTLETLAKINKTKDVNEAFLCLTALIEHFDSLINKNDKMWIFNSYRIGNIQNLAKDIEFWYQKLFIRLLLMRN